MVFLQRQEHIRTPWASQYLRGFFMFVLLVSPWCVYAQDEGFEVVSVDPQWSEGVYHLNAVISYSLSPEALEALESGVTLGFRVDLVIEREKQYWLDDNIAVLKQQYRLRYHALSDQYILTNVNSGAVHSFTTLNGALTVMGNILALPVIDYNLLDASHRYTARMRARLELDELPTPLRLLSYVKSGWRLTSEWHTWNLTLSDD